MSSLSPINNNPTEEVTMSTATTSTHDYSAADIKRALCAVAYREGRATLQAAIEFLDDEAMDEDIFSSCTPEQIEGERRAEFMSSWVHGGGHPEDASSAYDLLGR